VIARTTPGRIFAVLLSVALSQIVAPAARAGDQHLVGADQVGTRLADRAAERLQRVQAVQAALDGDEARRQAGAMGLSIGKLRAAVPHLSDAELADLSTRAKRVNDVAAGHRSNDGLVIVGLILLIAGVAILVAVGDYGTYYEDCGCYY
jgi:hypothetical protein